MALTPSCLLAAPTRTTLQDVQRRDDSDSNDDASSSNYLISSISNVWRQAGSCDLSSVTLPLGKFSPLRIRLTSSRPNFAGRETPSRPIPTQSVPSKMTQR